MKELFLLFIAILACLVAGCRGDAGPAATEDDRAAAYIGMLQPWSAFMEVGEEEIVASMEARPDTLAGSGEAVALVYHVVPQEISRIFVLSQGRLAEDMFILYFQDEEEALSFYQAAADHYREGHGPSTLEIEDGVLWTLHAGAATDSLRGVVTALRERKGLPRDSLADGTAATLGALLAAAPEAERARLTGLLKQHRAERVYVGKLVFQNVHTVTISRASGPRAIWTSEGQLLNLDTL